MNDQIEHNNHLIYKFSFFGEVENYSLKKNFTHSREIDKKHNFLKLNTKDTLLPRNDTKIRFSIYFTIVKTTV
jgi:hypothetical protein